MLRTNGRLYPFSPSRHGNVWFLLLPFFSLLLTNTVSFVRACRILRWERFRENQKEDDRGPLSIQSSLLRTNCLRYVCYVLEGFSATFSAICLKTIQKWKRFIDKHFHRTQDISRWNIRFRMEAT